MSTRHAWVVVVLAFAGCSGDDPAGAVQGDGTGDGTGADAGGEDGGLPGPGWSGRVRIDFAEDVLGLGLTDVPVLVRLDATRVPYDMLSPVDADVRFYDGALETALSHEVERWDTEADSFVWVRVPSLEDSDAGRSMWMYYGKDGLPDTDPTEVWTGDYVAVWHMQDDGSGSVADATGNGHAATLVGGGVRLAPSDLIGTALSVEGSASYLEVPPDAALSPGQPLSIEGWVRPVNVEPRARYLVRKRDEYAVELATQDEGVPSGVVWFSESGERAASADAALPFGDWSHLAMTFDGSAGHFALWVDGRQVVSREPPSDAPAASDVEIQLGLEAYGSVDEVRISSVLRSADEMRVQNMAARDELLTFNPPEAP